MQKTIKLIDSVGNEIGSTYPKRAKGLIKSGRARMISDDSICMLSMPREDILEDKIKRNPKEDYFDTETKPKGLKKITIPNYNLSEELLNSISHGIGAALSIVALILCIIAGAKHHNGYAIVSGIIYGLTSIILYIISCLYHSLKVNRAKKVFRILDHCTIYFLIAGTYTPYALVTLREYNPVMGWTLFGVIWACAALGIVFTAIDLNKYKVFGMVLYLIMGWMILFNFKSMIAAIARNGLYLMLAAGIVYTIGAILYGIGKNIKYFHSVFHFFVLAASVFFFLSIYLYVM